MDFPPVWSRPDLHAAARKHAQDDGHGEDESWIDSVLAAYDAADTRGLYLLVYVYDESLDSEDYGRWVLKTFGKGGDIEPSSPVLGAPRKLDGASLLAFVPHATPRTQSVSVQASFDLSAPAGVLDSTEVERLVESVAMYGALRWTEGSGAKGFSEQDDTGIDAFDRGVRFTRVAVTGVTR